MVANTVTVESTPNTVTSAPVITRVTTSKLDVNVSTPDETVTLSLDLLEATVTTIEAPVSVVVDNPVLSVLTVGVQGPAGADGRDGSFEDEIMYTKRVDFITDDLLYRGEADPGTTEDQALWRVRKLVINPVDGDVTETWADGTAAFTKVWDDRFLYIYN